MLQHKAPPQRWSTSLAHIIRTSSAVPASGNRTKQVAIWIDRDTILWNISGSGLTYALMYSPDVALELSPEGLAEIL